MTCHENFLGTWWKHFKNIKIQKIQNYLKFNFGTILKKKLEPKTRCFHRG